MTFNNNYERAVIKVLAEAGDRGLSLNKITRHVLNSCNNLFNTIDWIKKVCSGDPLYAMLYSLGGFSEDYQIEYNDVYKVVALYLKANSKGYDSAIQKTSRGIYRLNPNAVNQLSLLFKEEEEEQTEKRQNTDLSLSLF